MISFLVQLFRRRIYLPTEAEAGLWLERRRAEAYRRLNLATDQFEQAQERWRADPTAQNTQAVEYAWETFKDAQRGVQAVNALRDRHIRRVWRYGNQA